MGAVMKYESLASRFGGIYDVPEAARYLKASEQGKSVYPVSAVKLISWIRRGVGSPDLVAVPGRELLIEFEDLVSMRVIAALRASGVGWPASTKPNCGCAARQGLSVPSPLRPSGPARTRSSLNGAGSLSPPVPPDSSPSICSWTTCCP